METHSHIYTHIMRAVCGRDEMILMYLEILRAILMCILVQYIRL